LQSDFDDDREQRHMTGHDDRRLETVRSLYRAFLDLRPDLAQPLLTEDFTFSSPRDDHIDRQSYFERCWPTEKMFRAFHVEHLVADGDTVLLGYRAEKMDGGSFRNIETLRFDGEKIAEVTVYFGRSL
jgi:ketosteroid isomerase-like protein